MEFGALHCAARRPRCQDCPVADHCRAHPGMPEALAGVPRASRRESGLRYEDSNRYLRGKVLAQLRDAGTAGALELREIGSRLRRDDADVELSRLWAAVNSLEDDGLARTTLAEDPPPSLWPEPTGAVAEKRAAYGAGPAAETLAGIRVALP
jgi:A/G-specific adenine glycosylase